MSEPPEGSGPLDKAWADGRRSAFLDAQLDGHERRLNAINGSIERHARNLARLASDVSELSETLSEKIDNVSAQLTTRAAVEADRVAQLKTANERALSSRAFIIGISSVIAVLLGVLVTLAQGVH